MQADASQPQVFSDLFLLPHPSPGNRGWLKQNPWFEADVLP